MKEKVGKVEFGQHGPVQTLSADPEVMQAAIAQYLKTRGWYVLVAGELEVRGLGTGQSGNYEFVMRFTGKKA